MIPTDTHDRRRLATASDLFVTTLRGVVVAWCAVMGMTTVGLAAFAPESVSVGIAIAIGSGLISVLALIPGCFLQQPNTQQPNTQQPNTQQPNTQQRGNGSLESGRRTGLTANLFLVGASAAMAIRFAGTVALFVACRYQFGVTTETVAILVCSWYMLLTSVEIFFLARNASTIDSIIDQSSRQRSGLESVSDEPNLGLSQTPLTDSTLG
ncbi:hypothetical protein K227x_21960 [Rubripirellula lacrimiformis]|uniref:Uncharacterized protein n=1 Tax=Rubripirellula lacrimiformis TaxID=1930273 RepID=A0A517N9K1_9BACT|nr:hypothetical protein [Rubripirellula lacrimiformis]QDT03811.1 hypothetical protein K227x_21960 [Rubripirellula lacrimiformis]